MKLKVYGWQGSRLECPAAPNGCRQTREIVAATSMAAVARAVGVNSPKVLFNLCETANAREIETAMAEPGVIFWRSTNDWNGEYRRSS